VNTRDDEPQAGGLHVRKIEEVSVGQGRTRVDLELYEVGADLLAVLGGAGAHIGAATLAERAADAPSTLSTLTAIGHREAELTLEFSNAVTSATGRRTLAIAGIHLDGITKPEIQAIRRAVRKLSAIAISRCGRRHHAGCRKLK
jgi:hypothetical protein